MDLNKLHSVYFIGIGGIGMSAIARWFHQQGKTVAGYDKTPTPLTDQLQQEGLSITFTDHEDELPNNLSLETSLIVYTPAIPKDNQILNYFIDAKYPLLKRSQVLGIITKNYHTLAVAGTHGKTSTSCLLAHLLKENQQNVLAFLGGISKNFNSNVIYNDPNKATTVVIEADEFDRSFLQLSPNNVIVTSSDPDHLDIYNNQEVFEQGFADFVGLADHKSLSVMHHDVSEKVFQSAKGEKYRYGTSTDSIYPKNVNAVNGIQAFDYCGKINIEGLLLPLPGRHNILNACAAITLALNEGVSKEGIKTALANFKGIKRRFEYIVKTKDKIYIDDYAHHPTEISACLNGVKELFEGKTVSVIFQPHLFSRTKDFMDGFAQALSIADCVYLMDIYPARELPLPGITSDVLFEKMTLTNKIRVTKTDLLAKIKDDQSDILLTMGAGDIDQFVTPIKQLLEEQYG